MCLWEDEFKYWHFSLWKTLRYGYLTGNVSQSPTLAKLQKFSVVLALHTYSSIKFGKICQVWPAPASRIKTLPASQKILHVPSVVPIELFYCFSVGTSSTTCSVEYRRCKSWDGIVTLFESVNNKSWEITPHSLIIISEPFFYSSFSSSSLSNPLPNPINTSF